MKKAVKIILISVLGICGLAILAGYIALTQIDFNHYKNAIIKVVRNSTGRDLTIGDIQVKASFNPTVELRDVTFSNAKWAKAPLMVQAEAVDLGFAVIPLLRKDIVIDTFKLSNAVVNLEEGAQGANWEMNLPETLPEIKTSRSFSLIKDAQAAEAQSNDVAKMLSSLVVKQVAMENVVLNYTNKAAQKETFNINYLNLDENSADGIDFKFDVNKGLYAGKGTLGALKLLNAEQGYPLQIDANIMGIQTVANAVLYDMFGNMRFEGDAKASNFVGKNSGLNERAEVSFKGDLKKISAVIKEFVIAGNVIKGTADISLAEKNPAIKASLNAGMIDISSFETQKTALGFSFVKSAEATTLVSAQPIPYSALKNINANVDANIAKLTKKNAVLAENLVLNTKVNGGNATVKLLSGNIAGGAATASVILNGQTRNASINADVSKLNLLALFKALNFDSPVFNIMNGGDSDIHIKLTGHGNTYADVVGSMDGQVVAIVNKSQVHLGNIGVLKGNIISQLLNTLKVAKSNDDLNLRCAVVRADLKNGKASLPNGIVLNADKFTLVANGDVNLNNDKINISVKPFAGKLTDTNIAKALSSLVKLTGTIQNPKIGVDGANAIKTIVGVTTTGPVYLGAQMLLENDGSPCYTALQGTGYETMFPKPENVVQSTTGDVGQILNDSVGVVKDTTKGILNLLSGGSLERNSKSQQ